MGRRDSLVGGSRPCRCRQWEAEGGGDEREKVELGRVGAKEKKGGDFLRGEKGTFEREHDKRGTSKLQSIRPPEKKVKEKGREWEGRKKGGKGRYDENGEVVGDGDGDGKRNNAES